MTTKPQKQPKNGRSSKKSLVFLLCLFIVGFGYGQTNLVPNPSFEEKTGCPQAYPDLDGVCDDWFSFRSSPDYINNCSSICGYDNQFGFQEPKTGQAYTGIGVYQTSLSNIREHLGVELISPLVIGTKYYMSFYISPAYKYFSPVNLMCNKIGGLLTTQPYNDPNGTRPLPNDCQLYTDSIVKDTNEWFQVFGSFVADSVYNYIVIGNFFDDSYIDTVEFPNPFGPYNAYYYVDDVCLSTDSIFSQNWASMSEHNKINIEFYPNPIINELHISSEFEIDKINILNIVGESVLFITELDKKSVDLFLDDLNSGVYFLELFSKSEKSVIEIIINH